MNPKYYRYYTYIKPVFANKNIRSYAGLVFSMITITIFGYFAIRPTISTIISLQRSIDEQRQITEKINKKIQDIKVAKQNYDNLGQKTLDNLNAQLPTSPEVAQIIENLNILANQNQATVSGFQFQPIQYPSKSRTIPASPKIKEMVFNFNIQGSFPQVSKTLEDFTNTDRLISVDSVNINKTEERILIMTVNAKAYYLE